MILVWLWFRSPRTHLRRQGCGLLNRHTSLTLTVFAAGPGWPSARQAAQRDWPAAAGAVGPPAGRAPRACDDARCGAHERASPRRSDRPSLAPASPTFPWPACPAQCRPAARQGSRSSSQRYSPQVALLKSSLLLKSKLSLSPKLQMSSKPQMSLRLPLSSRPPLPDWLRAPRWAAASPARRYQMTKLRLPPSSSRRLGPSSSSRRAWRRPLGPAQPRAQAAFPQPAFASVRYRASGCRSPELLPELARQPEGGLRMLRAPSPAQRAPQRPWPGRALSPPRCRRARRRASASSARCAGRR